MKAGEIITLASAPGYTYPQIKATEARTRDALHARAYVHFGTHSDESYGKADACAPVTNGTADEVLVVKVIAVVKRSAKVEE